MYRTDSNVFVSALMHGLLLLLWIAIATVLRFTNLTAKAFWSDEFSTLVFSLGNSFLTIPLDHAISFTELLQPLQPDLQANLRSVIEHLITESNHPPLYFVLNHGWLKLFPTEDGVASLWAARAFSAVCGVLAVPLTFGVGWLAFRSRRAGHLAALFMALSPFGIYLAQEARHYTLAIVWILASLACLVAATQQLQQGRRMSLWLCFTWIGVNGLGIATHFFVLLTLLAEAIALLGVLAFHPFAPLPLSSSPHLLIRNPFSVAHKSSNLWRLVSVMVGTLASTMIWLPVLGGIRGTELTRWLQPGEFDQSSGLDHLLRLLAGLTTMLYLLPIQDVSIWVAIASGIGMVLLLIGTVPILVRGIKSLLKDPQSAPVVSVLLGFVGTAIALSLLLTFGVGVNFASVFRYQFFYFPAVMVLVGAALATQWNQKISFVPGYKGWKVHGRRVVISIVVLSFLGGLMVVSGWGYQKTHRPDQVAASIHQTFQTPTLIATPHQTHGQTGRLMGIAWELHRLDPVQAKETLFLLAHAPQPEPRQAIATLQRTLTKLSRPLVVWRVNFRGSANPASHSVLTQQGCFPTQKLRSTDGYRYQPYDCLTNTKPLSIERRRNASQIRR